MGGYVKPALPRLLAILTLTSVVVRTGDHSFIGMLLYRPTHPILTLSTGQIASLTGGESGNKSLLSIEMYVFLSFIQAAATNTFFRSAGNLS